MSKLAFRWWDLGKDGQLLSVNNVVWPPGETKASCMVMADHRGNPLPGHHPAEPDCGCGFWGFTDPEIAIGLPFHSPIWMRACKVFGVIEGYGRTQVHDLGYRFEKCEIRGLFVKRGKLHPVYREHGIVIHRTQEDLEQMWDVPETL